MSDSAVLRKSVCGLLMRLQVVQSLNKLLLCSCQTVDYKVPYAKDQPGTILDICLRKSLAGLQYSKLNIVDILQLIQTAYYVNFSSDNT